jgi:hypothetical protein
MKQWFFVALFTLCLSMAYGMDWPSGGALINNFGQNEDGSPVLGDSFETEGPVRAAERGEMIFVHEDSQLSSRLPSPMGSWIALDHGEGLVSIYSRLDEKSLRVGPGSTYIEKNTILGMAGQSGWSTRRGFHFSLFDRKERRWVNPSMIITPLLDTRPPTIQSVFFRNAQGRVIYPAQTRVISQGRYTISVDTMLGFNERPQAPYRIVCTINGSEIGSLTFDTFSARDGVLMIYRNGLVPVKQVYALSPAFEVGEVLFPRGQVTLDIIVSDIAGRSQSASFRFSVE